MTNESLTQREIELLRAIKTDKWTRDLLMAMGNTAVGLRAGRFIETDGVSWAHITRAGALALAAYEGEHHDK